MIEIPGQAALEQIASVASEADEPITPNQVAAVFAAYIAIVGGAELDTIMRNPENGAIAHRVNVDGLHMWRVSVPNGEQYNDLQPQLEGWEKISK